MSDGMFSGVVSYTVTRPQTAAEAGLPSTTNVSTGESVHILSSAGSGGSGETRQSWQSGGPTGSWSYTVTRPQTAAEAGLPEKDKTAVQQALTPTQQEYVKQYEKVVTPSATDPMGYYKAVAPVIPGGPALNVETLGMTGWGNVPEARERVIGGIISQQLTPQQVAALSPGGYVQTPSGRSYYGGSESVWLTTTAVVKPTSIFEKALPGGGEVAIFGGKGLLTGYSYTYSDKPLFGSPEKPNVPSGWVFSEVPLVGVFTNIKTGKYASVSGTPPKEFIPVTGTSGMWTSPPQKQELSNMLKPTGLTPDSIFGWTKQPSIFGESVTAAGKMSILQSKEQLSPTIESPQQIALENMFPLTTAVGKGFDIMFSGAKEFMSPLGGVGDWIYGGGKAAYTSFTFPVTAPVDIATHLTEVAGGVGEVFTPQFYTFEKSMTILKAGAIFGTGAYLFGGPGVVWERSQEAVGIGGAKFLVGVGITSVLTGQNPLAVTAMIGGGSLGFEETSYLFKGMTPTRLAEQRQEIFKVGFERYLEKNVPKIEYPLYARQTPETPTLLMPDLDEYMSISSAFRGQDIKYIGMGDQPVMFGFEHWQAVGEGRVVGFTKQLQPIDISEVSQKYVDAITGKAGGKIDLGNLEYATTGEMLRKGSVFEDIGGGVVSVRAGEYGISGPVLLFKNTLIDFEPEGLVKVTGVIGTKQFSYRLTGGGVGGTEEGLLYDTLGIRTGELRTGITKNVAGYAEFSLFKGTANLYEMETGISTNVPMPVGGINIKETFSIGKPISILEFTPASQLAVESTYGVRGGGAHTPWSVTMPDYVDFVDLGGGTAGVVATKGMMVSNIGIPFVSYEAGTTTLAGTSSLILPLGSFAGGGKVQQGRTMMMDTGITQGTRGTMDIVILVGQPSMISQKQFEFVQQPTSSMVKVLEMPASTQVFKLSEFQMPVTRAATKELLLPETRQVHEQVFKELMMPVTKEAMKEMQMEKAMQLQETKQVQEQIFQAPAPIFNMPIIPPPEPPRFSGGGFANVFNVPKSKLWKTGKIKSGRGEENPLASILESQQTQSRFMGRSWQLPRSPATLRRWRVAAGMGFIKGFPTRESARGLPKVKFDIFKTSKKKRRR